MNSDKVLIEVEIHSPDCSGYPTASLGKSFGARSSSGKREIAPEKTTPDFRTCSKISPSEKGNFLLFYRFQGNGVTTASYQMDWKFGLAVHCLFVDFVALRIVDVICIFSVFVNCCFVLFAFIKE